MHRGLGFLAMPVVAVLAGCAMSAPGGSAAAIGPRASAVLMDAAGARKGTASLEQTPAGLRVRVAATGMLPGSKGLHFHMTGRCEAPGFTTAGAHWNPSGMKHGKDSGAGPHMGDLPNIDIGAEGTGAVDMVVAGATLTGGAAPLLDADGAAIIIHATADDYRTDPSGNSGARMACGVLTAA